MYITQDIADRIKYRLKMQHKSMKNMLSSVGLGINAISEFSKGKQLSSISLAKIADYLDCSVDYLLGRTDNPEVNRAIVSNELTELTIGHLAAFGGSTKRIGYTEQEIKESDKARDQFHYESMSSFDEEK